MLWRRGVLTDLGVIGGNNSEANAVDNRCEIVGFSSTATDLARPVVWRHEVMTELDWPSVPGGYVYAKDINDRGEIIGVVGGSQVLLRRGALIELSGSDTSVQAINNRGWIVGTKQSSAVLWR